jgi:hypothetical protein
MFPVLSGQGVALSEDGQWMAAAIGSHEGMTIQIFSRLDETLQTIALPETSNSQAGAFVFSPDGSLLAFTLALDPCMESWTHRLIAVDLSTFETSMLYESADFHFQSIYWTEEGIILLDPVSVNGPVIFDPVSSEIISQ